MGMGERICFFQLAPAHGGIDVLPQEDLFFPRELLRPGRRRHIFAWQHLGAGEWIWLPSHRPGQASHLHRCSARWALASNPEERIGRSQPHAEQRIAKDLACQRQQPEPEVEPQQTGPEQRHQHQDRDGQRQSREGEPT